MKKVLSIFTAGIFLAGALVALAGCKSEVKDAALAAQIYEAVENAEIEQFEVVSKSKAEVTYEDKDSTLKTVSKQETTMKGYEADGKLYADIFTDNYFRTEEEAETTKTETGELYSVDFVRKSETYSASGAWKDEEVKKGNFSALVKQWKKDRKTLKGSYLLPDSLALDKDDVQSFGEISAESGAKVYKKGSGYLVEMDAEEFLEKVDGSFLTDIIGGGKAESKSIEGAVSVALDSSFNVTAASVDFEFFVTKKPGTSSTTTMRGEVDIKLKALKKAPVLTDLTGLKANMGYLFAVGEYNIPEDSAKLQTGGYRYIHGTYRGKATVTEEQRLIVEVTFTFTDGGETYSVTERREYSLQRYNYDFWELFDEWELPNGATVEMFGGIDYLFDNDVGGGTARLQINYSDSIYFPSALEIKNL